MISGLRTKAQYLAIFALSASVLLFQHCSNVSLELPSVKTQSVQGISGSFCFFYDAEMYSRYSLTDFYIVNMNARATKGSIYADSNMNGEIDIERSNEGAETVLISASDQDDDGLPDFLERLKGLNPTREDANEDGIDLDGVINKREIQLGTDPLLADKGVENTAYYVSQSDVEGEGCGREQPTYEFHISKISTVQTQKFKDNVNLTQRTNLSHEANENVILVLARMAPKNSKNEIIFLASLFKLESESSLSLKLKANDFFILGAENEDCPTCVDEDGESRIYKKVTTGHRHSCAISDKGKVYCWGNNSYGELGNGTHSPKSVPVRNQLLAEAKDIQSGESHTCVVTVSEEVYCWGRNLYGQLGDGTTEDSEAPVKVLLPAYAKSLALGANHSCAELSNGTLRCWGRNHSYQIGDGGQEQATLPVEVKLFNENNLPLGITFPLRGLTAGGNHNCLLDNRGIPYCWGEFAGCFETSLQRIPSNITGGSCGTSTSKAPNGQAYFYSSMTNLRFDQLATNGVINYGIVSTSKNGLCWSRGEILHASNYNLGCGLMNIESSGYYTQGISRLKKLALGTGRSCAIYEKPVSGQSSTFYTSLDCWGKDWGVETLVDPTPRAMSEIIQPLDVSISANHGCAIDKLGNLWCWGANDYYQLGLGSDMSRRSSPEKL